MPRWIRYAIVMLVSACAFSYMQNWGAFVDPDIYYHAKAAEIIAHSGPIKTFPWLDLTVFGGNRFADFHFLFHVALIPFVELGGMFGAQIAAVFFAALAMAVLYFVLDDLSIRWPWLWVGLALCTSSIAFRFSLGKATPLAIIWFLLGLLAVMKRRPWIGLITGIGFALTHYGFALLLACQGLYFFVDAVSHRWQKKSWRESIAHAPIKPFLLTTLGCAIGVLLHPNAGNLLASFWMNVTQIALKTQFGIINLGSEWGHMAAKELLYAFWVHLVFIIAALACLWASRKKEPRNEKQRQALVLFFPVLALTILMLKSRRMSEYAAPALIVWVALLWNAVDIPQIIGRVKQWAAEKHLQIPAAIKIPVLVIYLSIPVVCVVSSVYHVHEALRGPLERPVNQYRGAMEVVDKTANENERIFNTRWDDFPQLFYASSRVRYVEGLDPTYHLVADPVGTEKYSRLMSATSTSAVRNVVQNDFNCRLILTTKNDPKSFWKLLDTDPSFELMYADPDSRLYQIH